MMFRNSFILKMGATLFFCILLLIIRFIWTETLFLGFMLWNLFLACIPLLISSLITYFKFLQKPILFSLLVPIWILFLPNAPYMITDIIHIQKSSDVTMWLDLLIIFSFAMYGLALAYTSVLQIKEILKRYFSKHTLKFLIFCIWFLCGFGIYLGRVLRWNSWDVLNNPLDLLGDIGKRVLFPIEHLSSWLFAIGFGTFLTLFFYLFEEFRSKNKGLMNTYT